jgi:hypothetical protein
MRVVVTTVLIAAAIVIYVGPEAKGVSFMGTQRFAHSEINIAQERGTEEQLLPAKE